MSITLVITHATGDVFPATDWNTYVRDNINFGIIAGADLVAAATIIPTNRFHLVSGTTTIDNISPAVAIKSQGHKFLFVSALTIRNNGGGTGNIRTFTGADRTIRANEIVEFDYDGTVWREGPGVQGIRITVSTLAGGPPVAPADGDVWIATNVDGAGARWHFQYDVAEGTANKWKFIGGPPLIASAAQNTLASITPARSGIYNLNWSAYGGVSGGGDATAKMFIGGVLQDSLSMGNFTSASGNKQATVTGGTTALAAEFTGTTAPNGTGTISVTPVKIA